MTQEYYTTGRRKFQHLTIKKRAQLELLLKIKPRYTQKEMADLLGIARSTLNAEIARGSVEQLDTNLKPHKVYFADVGQRVYDENRKNSVNPFKVAKVAEFLSYAEHEILVEKHAPDVVCGVAKKDNLFGGNIVCTKTLGEDYTAESLVSRILWRDVGAAVSFDDNQPTPIRDDYFRRIDEVSQLAKDGKKVKRLRDHSAPYSPQNDMDVYKLSAQLSIINRDKIHSIGELEGKIEKLKDEYEKARVEVNLLTSKQEHLNDILEQSELFFSLSDKSSS